MNAKIKVIILVFTSIGLFFFLWQFGPFQSDTVVPLKKEEALANLRSQAEEMQKAITEADLEKCLDLTLPAVIERAGGRARMIELTSEVFKKYAGSKIESYQVDDAVLVASPTKQFFGIVQYRISMTLTNPRKVRGRMNSFLVGASDDGGRTWKFIDGGGIDDERASLNRLLPDFPANAQLPKKQAPVYEDL